MKRTIFTLLFLTSFLFGFTQDLRKVSFDKNFQKQYQGNAKVEINEVKELIHIMIAITSSGLENDDMVEQSTNYYKDVLAHFKKFNDEKIILTFDSLIKASPLNYIYLTGNAISYNFKGNQLIKDKYYLFPVHTPTKENPITLYKTDIEDFAKKSDFRKFYKHQKSFYQQVIADYNKQANISKQWKWLETNFTAKVNNYTIMCSPLIGGLNYTTKFEDNGFTQILLVLPTITTSPKMTETENIIQNTRTMFTEIDHNYVDVPSKKYNKEIDSALKNREKWVNTKQEGTKYYATPLRLFDEYMTWAVYYIYCYDLYKDHTDALNYAYRNINEVMQQRGFPMMKAFNDELLRLRKQKPNEKMDNLYPELIEWCKKQ